MEQWKKHLQKMSRGNRERVLMALSCIYARDIASLDCHRLKGYTNLFRIRVGDYRIIYYDDGEQIILKTIRRRNEKTYRDF